MTDRPRSRPDSVPDVFYLEGGNPRDARVHSEDPTGAFCDREPLPGPPDGVLLGLRFAAKDVLDVVGRVTGAGNPDWLRTHLPAEKSAWAVARLVDAGACLIGRTLTDEMALSMHGINWHYGTPLNPAAPDRLCGGSSCGSASVVAAGLVDFALGTDTGGSVRVPASYCKIFGFRPTHGRIPLDGVVPLAPTFDTVGVMTRDASTLARVADILLEPSAARRRPLVRRRLAVAVDAFAFAGEDVAEVLWPAVRALSAHFDELVYESLFEDGYDSYPATYCILAGAELWRAHSDWVEKVQPRFGPDARENFDGAAALLGPVAENAARHREVLASSLRRRVPENTVVCMPAAPGPPPLRATPLDALRDVAVRAITLTSPGGLARLPQITVPAAKLHGLPIGLSLLGAQGTDEDLIALARDLETGLRPKPPVRRAPVQ